VSKNILYRNSLLKRGLAAITVLLLVLSITPKKILHDLLANHIDASGGITDNPHPQISSSSFHCNTENLVAESPFNLIYNDIEFTTIPVFGKFTQSLQQLRPYTLSIISCLRGPPIF
jgi:hypothetical protein